MVFSVQWFIVGVIMVFVVLPILGWLVWYFTSFKYVARIARQTGSDPNDVVWINDKFKVVEKNGQYIIKFRIQKEKSQSFPYSFWSKHSNKNWKITHEEWLRMDLSKNIRRGLILYQTTEGEYHPMTIREYGKFEVLPQDNRAFIVSQYSHVNDLSITPTKAFIAAGILALAVIVLGVLFVLYLVYLQEAQLAQGVVQPAGNTFLNAAQGAVGA